jgi:hypothetical protein
MTSKRISDGLNAMAIGTTIATGIIAGVELEIPQQDHTNPEEVNQY